MKHHYKESSNPWAPGQTLCSSFGLQALVDNGSIPTRLGSIYVLIATDREDTILQHIIYISIILCYEYRHGL